MVPKVGYTDKITGFRLLGNIKMNSKKIEIYQIPCQNPSPSSSAARRTICLESYSYFYSTQDIEVTCKGFISLSEFVSISRHVEIKRLHISVKHIFKINGIILGLEAHHGFVNLSDNVDFLNEVTELIENLVLYV